MSPATIDCNVLFPCNGLFRCTADRSTSIDPATVDPTTVDSATVGSATAVPAAGKRVSLWAAAFLALVLLGVAAGAVAAPPAFDASQAPPSPDYAEPDSWLRLARHPDPGAVDVFWAYPTVLMDDASWLMDPMNPDHRRLAAATITRQASALSGGANLFVPMYRQMNMAGLALPEAKRDAFTNYGRDDLRAALLYYLNHLNGGRPFILAGHSQGSMQLLDLMTELWGKTGAEDRLVAAYVIGWSVTPETLQDNPALRLCESADQTGCIVSYNSIAPGRQKVAPTLLPGALAVNPLSWTTNGTEAPAELNLGAVFFAEDGAKTTRPRFTSATIVDGGLVVHPADLSLMPQGDGGFPQGVYHAYDYSLFYENLKANAAERAAAMPRN